MPGLVKEIITFFSLSSVPPWLLLRAYNPGGSAPISPKRIFSSSPTPKPNKSTYYTILSYRYLPVHTVAVLFEPSTFVNIPHTRPEMPRIKEWIEKLEVPTEPGLTNTQLMLTNRDLRPGEIMKLAGGSH